MAQVARTTGPWAAAGIVAIAVTAATASLQGIPLPQQPAVSPLQASPDADRVHSARSPAPGDSNGGRHCAGPTAGVRPLEPEAERLLADARRLSPTVRRLLALLESGDVVVYLEVRMPQSFRTGQLMLLGRTGGLRYLKVEISVLVWDRISWLAHELQHAVEIASAPEVTDDDALNRLYHRIGYRSSAHSWETSAAIVIGNQVLAELRCPR